MGTRDDDDSGEEVVYHEVPYSYAHRGKFYNRGDRMTLQGPEGEIHGTYERTVIDPDDATRDLLVIKEVRPKAVRVPQSTRKWTL